MEPSYYKRFSRFLKERFGGPVYRVCIDAGLTCPNRDGTLGYGGCAYCTPGGSWRKPETDSVTGQVRLEKERVRRRYGARKFIAYFQAHTNTYAPVDMLRRLYDAALTENDIVGLVVGTRPDCIDEERLELLASYRERGMYVLIEYGLQSAHDRTLELIERGHDSKTFHDAVQKTKGYGIDVGAHVIIGLPNEEAADIRETADFLSLLPIDLLKIHNLNIVSGTKMARWYREGAVSPLLLEEYAELVVDFLERTRPEVCIDRLVAESDPALLIAPRWPLNKQRAIRAINECFSRRDSYQGKCRQGIGTRPVS
ncbi:MAG: TIGR01212 family radical SAM protein [Spirochaetes bacterium]|nr:TIGR01212 family radical SAM protein [Spirochaetota bacterium]